MKAIFVTLFSLTVDPAFGIVCFTNKYDRNKIIHKNCPEEKNACKAIRYYGKNIQIKRDRKETGEILLMLLLGEILSHKPFH